jgi:SOCS box
VSASLSLQQLTCTAVHAALQDLPRTAVLQLPLPKILRDYLLFPDLDLPVLEEDIKHEAERNEVCHIFY